MIPFNASSFPDRKIKIVFDAVNLRMVEQGINIARNMQKVSRTIEPDNCVFEEGIGWTLSSAPANYSFYEEISGSEAPKDLLRTGQTTSDITQTATRKNVSAFKSVYTSKEASLFKTYIRAVNPVLGWVLSLPFPSSLLRFDTTNIFKPASPALSVGQYPKEPVEDLYMPYNVVYISNEPDKQDNDILFSFRLLEHEGVYADVPIMLYFIGPASFTGSHAGTGEYVLRIEVNTLKAHLYERIASNRHVKVHSFGLRPVNKDETIWIHIKKYKAQPGRPGMIIFKQGIGSATLPYSVTRTVTETDTASPTMSVTSVYYTKQNALDTPVQEKPIVIEVRQDVLAEFAVKDVGYASEGWLWSDAIQFPFYPRATDSPFYLFYTADTPPGTTVTVYLVDTDDNVEYPLESTGDNFKRYTPKTTNRRVRVAVKMTTNDDSVTPVFKGFQLFRFGRVEADPDSSNEIVLDNPEGCVINIVTQSGDMETASASIGFTLTDWPTSPVNKDLINILKTRGSIPVRIDCDFKKDDGTTATCTLFKGFTKEVKTFPKPFPRSFMYRKTSYDISCVSQIQVLQEQFSKVITSFQGPAIDDFSSTLPMKVTDVIKYILFLSGIPADQIDIPSEEIRLFNNIPGSKLTLLPGVQMYDVIKTYLAMYLPHFLWYDFNANTSGILAGAQNFGKYKLLPQAVSPFYEKIKAVFVIPLETELFTGASHQYKSYAKYTNASSEQVPVLPILKNTYISMVRPPEYNALVVSSIGATMLHSAQQSLSKGFINSKSWDFTPGSADKNSIDYVNRLIERAVNILSLANDGNTDNIDQALTYVGARLMQVGGQGLKYVTFTAPLLFIANAGETNRFRMLRHQDVVGVTNLEDQVVPLLIDTVKITITKAYEMWATYDCIVPQPELSVE